MEDKDYQKKVLELLESGKIDRDLASKFLDSKSSGKPSDLEKEIKTEDVKVTFGNRFGAGLFWGISCAATGYVGVPLVLKYFFNTQISNSTAGIIAAVSAGFNFLLALGGGYDGFIRKSLYKDKEK